eukprot:2686603-Rhodomonas_salina.1
MRDHGVELSQEAKQAVGRVAASMYRAAYHEDPLKNKQVVNGKRAIRRLVQAQARRPPCASCQRVQDGSGTQARARPAQ